MTSAPPPNWDQRYLADGYLFGTEPAAFLTAHAHLIEPGAKVLAVADGEGRNSVYVAGLGADVTAFDASTVGVEKARSLATEHGVTVDISEADIHTWAWTPDTYDIVLAVFIQFLTPGERPPVFDGMVRTLRPGGRLLLHGYRPEQVDYGTGGPPVRENMYTEEFLDAAFPGLETERLAAYNTEIVEGTGHAGMSALIDLVARKP